MELLVTMSPERIKNKRLTLHFYRVYEKSILSKSVDIGIALKPIHHGRFIYYDWNGESKTEKFIFLYEVMFYKDKSKIDEFSKWCKEQGFQLFIER